MSVSVLNVRHLAVCALLSCCWAVSGRNRLTTYKELSLLHRVRERFAKEAQRIPDYTCTEHITRSRFAGSLRKLLKTDRLRLEVAFVGQEELFAWPGDPFRYRDPAHLISSGLSGTGDFATVLLNILLSDFVSYGAATREVFEGQNAVRFAYRISEPVCRLKFNSVEASVRYHGSFWVNAETERLLAVEVVAENIPEALGISGLKTRIDLQQLVIDGSEVTLPRSTVLTSTPFPDGGQSNIEETNRTEFENCHRYTAESTISFAEQDGRVTAPASSAAKMRELPAGIRVNAALETPIDASTSAAGDAIAATILKPVRTGSLTIPKGARVLGRLLLLQVDVENACVTTTLDFSRIEVAGSHLLFHGRLNSLHWRPGLVQPGQILSGFRRELREATTLQMRDGLLRIPAGIEMEWVTVEREPESEAH